MNSVKKLTIALAVAAAVPLLAAAQITQITSSGITSIGDFVGWLGALLNFLFGIVGVIAVLAIIWSAILFLTSGDNEDRRRSATGFLKWGIVGIVVAVLAFTIIPIINSIIGL